ncbi:MAG: putative ATP-binding protein involved in virulence [Bacteroidota bacterium]|nr:putative ATP-binding protein involved in virulence [Bacteroidota bacterium]
MQVNNIPEKVSVFKLCNRISAKWLSGASRDIIDKLLPVDIAPYARIGYFNCIIIMLSVTAASWLANIFFNNVYISVLFTYFILASISFLLIGSSRTLINDYDLTKIDTSIPVKNSRRSSSFLPFIFINFLIFIIIVSGFSLHSANKNRIKNAHISQSVQDTLSSIKLRVEQLSLDDPSDTTIDFYNSRIAYSSIVDLEIYERIKYENQFASIAEKNLKYLPLKDSMDINDRVHQLKRLAYLNYSYAVYLNQSNEKINVRKLEDIPMEDLNEITAYYNPSNFQKLTLDAKFVVLIKYFTVISYLTLFIILFLVIVLFALVVSTINNYSDDFYHTLLYEKKLLESQELIDQRKKIAEDYRLRSELRNIKSGLEEQLDKVEDEDKSEISSYSKELSGDLSPSGLLTAAEIACRQQDFQKGIDYINKAIELETNLLQENKNYLQIPEIYELKAKILKSMNLFDDAEIAEKSARNIRNENSFLNNKDKKIKLERLVVEDTSIFANFTWYFKPGINILLGKNGYGKSHLLGLIIALLYDDKIKIKDWIQGSKAEAKASLYLSGDIPGKEIEEQLFSLTQESRKAQTNLDNEIKIFLATPDKNYTDEDIEKTFADQIKQVDNINNQVIEVQEKLKQYTPAICADTNTIKTQTGRIPLLAIPDSRFIDKSGEAVLAYASEYSDIARYGAYEFLYSLPYMKVIENALFKSCILYFENGKSFQEEPFGLIQKVIKDLSSDKLVSKDGQLIFQDESKFEFISIESNDKNASFSIKVKPEDTQIILPIQKVSQGTFSIVAICCLIFNYLKSVQQEQTQILKRYAIVIIDELDAHIHPSWQRKLVQILRKNFPNVQFIISGHSPLLLEGCKANEVSVLRRTSEGKFKIEMINKTLIGYTIESIYSLIFEVENKDFAMLRYKELSPYLNEFKKELEELKIKGENLSENDIDRLLELQDLVAHIDVSTTTFEKIQIEKQKESQEISDFLKSASESVIDNIQ